MIKVQNLTKKYKTNVKVSKSSTSYALDNVSLTIKEGKITAILGTNGSGKTTLLKSLMGFVRPTSGKVFIDDEKISHKSYEKMIFIPDCPTHFPGFSIKEMMDFYKDFYPTWNSEKEREMLDFFGLDINQNIDSLSKGNIAKVKLVLGFCLDMKYIIMDEPFNGIDIFKREEFVSVMARFMEEDQAIILSTHEIDEIEKIVDYVFILSDGKLVSEFDAEEMRSLEGKSIIEKIREVSLND